MTEVTIHNKATVNAKGRRNGGCCKPVICIDNGKRYTSVTDAAEQAGVTTCSMSQHLNGLSRTCKGKRYCYLNQLTENANMIMDRLNEALIDAEDARRWREYQAEQEANRLAEERRLRNIEKAREKIAEYEEKSAAYRDKMFEAMSLKEEAERKLDALLNNEEVA